MAGGRGHRHANVSHGWLVGSGLRRTGERPDEDLRDAPIEMEGVKGKSYTGVMSIDASGGKSQERGYVVVTMENGDKAFVRVVSGASTLDKDGNPVSGEGTWTYTGGTGKFKGLKGKGTYKAKGGAEDMIEGEYMLPPPPPAKK